MGAIQTPLPSLPPPDTLDVLDLATVPVRYRVDWPALATNLLPALLRKPTVVAWLLALLAPLRQLYAHFVRYQAAAFHELAYNSQTIVLEGALNDQFDPSGRRIRVTNLEDELVPLYLNFISEGQPPKYMGYKLEGGPALYPHSGQEFANQLDFVVRVPAVLRTAERTTQLHARINRFRLSQRRYSLRFV